MDRILTVTEAARNFADVVNRAFYRHESTLLMKGKEAVARIVPVGPDIVTGRELAQKRKNRSRLGAAEADLFAKDLERARAELPPLSNPWD